MKIQLSKIRQLCDERINIIDNLDEDDHNEISKHKNVLILLHGIAYGLMNINENDLEKIINNYYEDI